MARFYGAVPLYQFPAMFASGKLFPAAFPSQHRFLEVPHSSDCSALRLTCSVNCGILPPMNNRRCALVRPDLEQGVYPCRTDNGLLPLFALQQRARL